eukprot:202629-Hanusia_phi.AAC.1
MHPTSTAAAQFSRCFHRLSKLRNQLNDSATLPSCLTVRNRARESRAGPGGYRSHCDYGTVP